MRYGILLLCMPKIQTILGPGHHHSVRLFVGRGLKVGDKMDVLIKMESNKLGGVFHIKHCTRDSTEWDPVTKSLNSHVVSVDLPNNFV